MLPSDLDGVAEPRGGEQGGWCSFAFDEGIGHERRSVDQCAPLTALDGAIVQHRLESAFYGEAGVARRGECFPDNSAAVFCDQKHVGKSSADVDANPIHFKSTFAALVARF